MNTLNPISSIMSQELITLSPAASMAEVHIIFSQNRIHHIPVVEAGTLVGIISKSDYLFFRRDKKVDMAQLESQSVAEVMTQGIATLNSDARISVAVEVFKENLFHAIPIVDEDRLVGIVTTFDIINELSLLQSAN